MAWVMPVMMVAGTVISAYGQMQAGEAAEAQAAAQQTALDFQAGEARKQAGQERAAAQREMISARRRERLVQSNLIASAAASGAGASDPTLLAPKVDIAADGASRALTALYQGQERWRSLEHQAAPRQCTGAQQT